MTTLNRRAFIKLAGILSVQAGLFGCSAPQIGVRAASAANWPTSLVPAKAQACSECNRTIKPAVHLLKRLTFGPRPGDVERVQAMGREAFIEEQLNPSALDTGRADQAASRFKTLNAEVVDLLEDKQAKTAQELNAATLARALYSEQQLHEVMVDFWSNHFNIFQRKGLCRALKIADDRDAIRPHALGNFRDLLGASAHSPAMLFYLDNQQNIAGGLNENYARELLELHTLGVNGGYTHDDIVNVARAFTGWSIARRRHRQPGSFRFYPRRHDREAKTLLGHRLPAGQNEADGEAVLDILAAHPGTAYHISRKLCIRFISDEPPESAIKAAADTFGQTGGDIKAVLRAIFHSQAFADSAGQKVKRPFEFLVSMLRALAVDVQDFRLLVLALRNMGQPLFMWPTPDGYPDQAAAWMNTNGLLARWNVAAQFAQLAAQKKNRGIQVDLNAPLKAANAQTPAEILDLFSELILHHRLPDGERDLFLNLLNDRETVPLVVGLLIASPHFQYR